MNYYDKTLLDITRWGRIGSISCRISERLGISPLQSLKMFYKSMTCDKFHDRATGMYLYSDLYIVDSFLAEMNIL